jgi:hypothetical protein
MAQTIPSGYVLISATQTGANARAVDAAADRASVSRSTISYSPNLGGYIVPTAVQTAYVAAPAGDPFDVSNRIFVFPTKSGAGKTTVTDADFASAPNDSTAVLVVNSTNGSAKIAVRVAGTWLYTALA